MAPLFDCTSRCHFSSPQSGCLPVWVRSNGPWAAHRFLNSWAEAFCISFHFEDAISVDWKGRGRKRKGWGGGSDAEATRARKVIVSCCSLGAKISAAGSIAQLTSAGTHARTQTGRFSFCRSWEASRYPRVPREMGKTRSACLHLHNRECLTAWKLSGGRSGIF